MTAEAPATDKTPTSPGNDAPKPAEPGRFATLSASLLARKGEAEPALEPFAHARVAESARQMGPGERHLITRRSARAPGAGPGTGQDRPMAERMGADRAAAERVGSDRAGSSDRADCPRLPGAAGKRAAVTFRMSIHDFLRLQLASVELEKSTQDIVVDALSAYLDERGVESLSECLCLNNRSGEACAVLPRQQQAAAE